MYDLKKKDDFIKVFEQSVKECWEKPALGEYNNPFLTYGARAEEIEKNILCWKEAGLKPGDKIAINARSVCFNCSIGTSSVRRLDAAPRLAEHRGKVAEIMEDLAAIQHFLRRVVGFALGEVFVEAVHRRLVRRRIIDVFRIARRKIAVV